MDLRFTGAEPGVDVREAVDRVLGPPESGWAGGERSAAELQASSGGHVARGRRDLLLEALHAVNDRVGWIGPEALDYVGRRLMVPPAEAYAVATFYALFSVHPRPARLVHVCTDVACQANGSKALCAAVADRLGRAGDASGWLESPCLGLCERAPVALGIQAGDPPVHRVLAPAGAGDVTSAVEEGLPAVDGEPEATAAVPQVAGAGGGAGGEDLWLLGRIGRVDPESLDSYRAAGGYAALRQAFWLGPSGVIREVSDAKLMGRGGAAFPTARKWEATAGQLASPHYLVCNADESETGTFKDRVLMEGDPYAVVESMTIAGFATRSQRGFIYLRGEYPRAWRRLQHAIEECRHRGLLGEDIMGQGFAFDIEIRRGAGAYICGEETAIFNSVEGYRGEPRSKPPFPVEQGLFGKPTAVNNVETLLNVLPILTRGGRAYAQVGTESSTGPRLFCVSGTIARPGIYELPFGATLGELLELAGGVPAGRQLRAVLLGGAAGGFVRADELDLPLTFEGTREAGTTLGSGVVLALDDTVNLPAVLLRIAAFFRDESCGQCVPCRVGTVRQEEALHRMAQSNGQANGQSTGQANGHDRSGDHAGDLVLLREVGTAMRDASICGLGQTAWNAIESAIDRLGAFPEPPPDSTARTTPTSGE